MAAPRRDPPPLTHERPIRFRPTVARHVGIVGAAVLERIWYLTQAEHARRRPHAGRVFVCYPARMMAEDFHFVAGKTLRRAVDQLRRAGLLARAKARGDGRDASAWYGVDKAAVDALGTLFPPRPTHDAPADRPRPMERRPDAR